MEQNKAGMRQAIIDVLASTVSMARHNNVECADAILQRLSELQPKPSESERGITIKNIYAKPAEDRVKQIEEIARRYWDELIGWHHMAIEIASTEPARVQPANKTDDELVRHIHAILSVNMRMVGFDGCTTLAVTEDDFDSVSEHIASLLPSSPSRENGVNVELLEALKKLRESASKALTFIPAKYIENKELDDVLCEVLDVIENA